MVLVELVIQSVTLLVILPCPSLVESNPEVAMDCIIHMSQSITPSQRAKVSYLLATMDTSSNASSSSSSSSS